MPMEEGGGRGIFWVFSVTKFISVDDDNTIGWSSPKQSEMLRRNCTRQCNAYCNKLKIRSPAFVTSDITRA
jgi:hypothetical protein